jgi:hypothetical protein
MGGLGVKGARAWRRTANGLALVGLTAAALALLVVAWPGATAAWAEHLYPAWSRWLVPVTERGPLPWTLPVLLVTLAGLVATAPRGPGRRSTALAWGGLASLLAATLVLGWGAHAARPEAPQRLGWDQDPLGGPATSVEARAAAARLALRLAEVIATDLPAGPIDVPGATAATAAELERIAPGVRLPRRLDALPSPLLGPLGVGGVISPWTLEAHVDTGLPAWARAAVGAHELAHLAGFVHEADAEAVGLLAALRSDHADARYAAALRAWAWLPGEARAAAPLPPRAASDLDRLRAYARTARGPLAGPAWRAYDLALRATGQEAGVAGYADGIRRLAAAEASGAW